MVPCLSIRIRITHSRFLCGFAACLLMHACTYCVRVRASVGVPLSVTLHRVGGSFLTADDRADFSCE